MAYTVKAVADLAGISIRTLHHYDEIGLLKPAQTSAAGYRLYTGEDLERLQQVLFFRELGLSLPEIKEIISRPDFDRRQALLDHRQLLLDRQQRLTRLIQSVDRTLDAMERGIHMDDKELFDGFDPAQYEEEARQRWGNTKEYAESAKRTKKYTKADWAAIKEEGGQIAQRLASLMDRGAADPDVQEAIRQHHQMINVGSTPVPSKFTVAWEICTCRMSDSLPTSTRPRRASPSSCSRRCMCTVTRSKANSVRGELHPGTRLLFVPLAPTLRAHPETPAAHRCG